MRRFIYVFAIFVSLLLFVDWDMIASAQENTNPQQFGYLKFATNIDSFVVLVDHDHKTGHKLGRGDSLRLAVGRHKITLASKNTFDHVFNIDIAADTTKVYRLTISPVDGLLAYLRNSTYPRLEWKANLMVLTDDDSEIFIGTKSFGHGQVKIDTAAGVYRITTKHKHAGTTSRKIALYINRFELVEMYNKPVKGTAAVLTVFPGVRQYYQNEKLKGLAFFGVFAGGVIFSYSHHKAFKEKNDDYLFALDRYNRARSEEEAVKFAKEAQSKFDLANQAANRRNIFLYAAIGLYALNFLDTLVPPKGGYRDMQQVKSRLKPFSAKDAIGLHYSIQF